VGPVQKELDQARRQGGLQLRLQTPTTPYAGWETFGQRKDRSRAGASGQKVFTRRQGR